jgi:hypothetical protein
MIPAKNDVGVFINGVLAVRLCASFARTKTSGDGHAMWSYNCKPLGWISNRWYLIECVSAALLVDGALTPRWETVPTGIRLIHPRYTLEARQTKDGWICSITDELYRRSHSLKTVKSKIDAQYLLENLLRRRLGRDRPSFQIGQWLGAYIETDKNHQFQLALDAAGPDIGVLIGTNHIAADHWDGDRLESALKLAKLLDENYYYGFDPLPFLVTTLATYIKSALIDVYSGANSIVVDHSGSTLKFTPQELKAFRDRFRRAPMTDDEYLDFVENHFASRLRTLRQKHRIPKFPFPYLKKLCPQRDSGDFPCAWPYPPGSRLEVWQGP